MWIDFIDCKSKEIYNTNATLNAISGHDVSEIVKD
jgi:hypothetical protein